MPSGINGTIPATNAALVSAPVRTNFATAASEITALQAQVGTTGPYLAIGVPQPTPTPFNGTVTANQVAISPMSLTSGILAPDTSASVGLNMYVDSTGAAHYIANGAGGMIDAHDRGTGVSRLSIVPYDMNNAGPGAAAPNSLGGVQVVFGQPGATPGPFLVVGIAGEIPTTVFPRRASIMANEISIRADNFMDTTPADRVSRFGLNAFVDNAMPAGIWHYLTDGPGGTVTVHDANAGSSVQLPAASLRFAVGDASTAGTAFPNAPRFVIFGPSGTATGQTNVMLTVNASGTPSLQQVSVGAPDSGGTGHRVLTVPN